MSNGMNVNSLRSKDGDWCQMLDALIETERTYGKEINERTMPRSQPSEILCRCTLYYPGNTTSEELATTDPSGRGAFNAAAARECQDTRSESFIVRGRPAYQSPIIAVSGNKSNERPVSNRRCFKDKRLSVPGDSHISPSPPDWKVA